MLGKTPNPTPFGGQCSFCSSTARYRLTIFGQRPASLSELSMRPREFLLRQGAAALRGAANACWFVTEELVSRLPCCPVMQRRGFCTNRRCGAGPPAALSTASTRSICTKWQHRLSLVAQAADRELPRNAVRAHREPNLSAAVQSPGSSTPRPIRDRPCGRRRWMRGRMR